MSRGFFSVLDFEEIYLALDTEAGSPRLWLMVQRKGKGPNKGELRTPDAGQLPEARPRPCRGGERGPSRRHGEHRAAYLCRRAELCYRERQEMPRRAAVVPLKKKNFRYA